MRHRMEINFIEEGYCRVYYKLKLKNGKYANYCLQDEGNGSVVPYSVSDSDWLEPCSPIKIDNCEFEIPDADSELTRNVRRFIEVNNCGPKPPNCPFCGKPLDMVVMGCCGSEVNGSVIMNHVCESGLEITWYSEGQDSTKAIEAIEMRTDKK